MALQEFKLLGCFELKDLPTFIIQLTTLQKLNLSGFFELELPISIGQLMALQKLDLSWCFKLKELPTSIGQLTALQELYLFQCS
jgi:Leucine-rich repeat (LRR) protein